MNTKDTSREMSSQQPQELPQERWYLNHKSYLKREVSNKHKDFLKREVTNKHKNFLKRDVFTINTRASSRERYSP